MSWIQKPKYPVKEQLPRIKLNQALPSGAVELGRMDDPNSSNTTVVLFQQDSWVSVLISDKQPRPLKNGGQIFSSIQADYPLGMLSWFCNALAEFQKPPAEGGLHAGAMTSADEDVEGEMLCIQRAMNAGPGVGGYALLNRSRKSRLVSGDEHFEPQEVTFADNLLYEAGLLDLIKDLGEKYRRGEL